MNKLWVTFAALAVPNFRRQWIASTLATTAFMTTFVLVPIVTSVTVSASSTDPMNNPGPG